MMVYMLFLGRGSFSGKLRFFRKGFKFFLRAAWRCFRKCTFAIYSGGVGIISVVLRGI